MAKKAVKEGNKSDAVRDYIAKNPGDSPISIVEGLKAEGVTVSPALASKIKYGRPAKGGAKKGGRIKKGAGRAAAASTNGSSGHGNKAEAIRAAAKSLGKKVRPRDVIAMLKEQGITVSSAQVSTTLKNMGMKKVRRGRRPGAGGIGAVSRGANRSEAFTIEDLIAAKKLVNQLGSVEAASKAISALARLG